MLPAGADIFELREAERAARAAEKAAAAALPVAEKTTFSCRQQRALGGASIRSGLGGAAAPAPPLWKGRGGGGSGGGGGGSGGRGGGGGLEGTVAGDYGYSGGGSDDDDSEGGGGHPPPLAAAACTAAARCRGARPPREDVRALLARKRELFFVQMSLDAKRAEAGKLEARARRRAEALAKSEAMLGEDAARFDAFLKENDEKVQEAVRRADAEAKVRVGACRGRGQCAVRGQEGRRIRVGRERGGRPPGSLIRCAFHAANLPPQPPLPPQLSSTSQARADRVAEAKRLAAAIAALRGDLGRKEEALADCDR